MLREQKKLQDCPISLSCVKFFVLACGVCPVFVLHPFSQLWLHHPSLSPWPLTYVQKPVPYSERLNLTQGRGVHRPHLSLLSTCFQDQGFLLLLQTEVQSSSTAALDATGYGKRSQTEGSKAEFSAAQLGHPRELRDTCSAPSMPKGADVLFQGYFRIMGKKFLLPVDFFTLF